MNPVFGRFKPRLKFIKFGHCLVLFAGSLQKWFAYFSCLSSNEETHRNKHCSSQKNDGIFHIFFRLMFQGYHCKSGIAIIYNEGNLKFRIHSFSQWITIFLIVLIICEVLWTDISTSGIDIPYTLLGWTIYLFFI